jgi:hypothetical protein
MYPLRILTFLFCGLTSFIYAATTPVAKENKTNQDGKKPAKQEEKNYNLRFAWWEPPAEIPDLYILSGNKYISVSPRVMSMSQEVGLNSNGTVDLLKKLVSTEKDNNGKPKESYEVYTSINLAQVESHDLGILLVPNRQKTAYGARVYDFSARGFPYGSFLAVNFTSSKIACTVEDSNFVVMPNSFAKSPKLFTARTIASIGMTATEPNGNENQIVSTKVVFNESMRTIYFVIPTQGINKYDVRCIIDIDSTPAKATDSKDNTEEPKTKPSKSKAA